MTKDAQDTIEDVLLGGAVTLSWVQDHVLGFILTIGSLVYLYYKIQTMRQRHLIETQKNKAAVIETELRQKHLEAYDELVRSFRSNELPPTLVQKMLEEKELFEEYKKTKEHEL